jgi:hypothetical protein
MKFSFNKLVGVGLAMVVANVLASDGEGRSMSTVPVNKTYKTECSSCHLAFPAALMAARDWQLLMGGLDKHFGTDATLDINATKEILDYLTTESNNGQYARKGRLGQVTNAVSQSASPNPNSMPRLTQTEWFVRKHDSREVSSALWKHPLVKSPANCAACHTTAEQNNFSERNIKLPR